MRNSEQATQAGQAKGDIACLPLGVFRVRTGERQPIQKYRTGIVASLAPDPVPTQQGRRLRRLRARGTSPNSERHRRVGRVKEYQQIKSLR